MKMRLTAAILAGMTAFSMMTACVSADENAIDKIKSAGKIVMTTNAEFEPFEYKDGDEIVGIDLDISHALADKLGVELEVADIAFDSLIPSLNAGKADFIAAGMTAIYQMEQLPLPIMILLHGGGLYIAYILTYLINGWLQQALGPIAIFTGIFVAGYAVIWLIIYCVEKGKAEALNRKLKGSA